MSVAAQETTTPTLVVVAVKSPPRPKSDIIGYSDTDEDSDDETSDEGSIYR